jgi:hypothetical protein
MLRVMPGKGGMPIVAVGSIVCIQLKAGPAEFISKTITRAWLGNGRGEVVSKD